MPDRPKIPRDPNYIDLRDPNEVRYWTSELKTDADTLLRAVHKVGNLAPVVRSYLKGPDRKTRK